MATAEETSSLKSISHTMTRILIVVVMNGLHERGSKG